MTKNVERRLSDFAIRWQHISTVRIKRCYSSEHTGSSWTLGLG